MFNCFSLSTEPKKKKKKTKTFSAVAIKIFTQGQFVLGNKGFKEKEAFPTKHSCLEGRPTTVVYTTVF